MELFRFAHKPLAILRTWIELISMVSVTQAGMMAPYLTPFS